MISELSKRCDCPRARWPKCPHGFHFRKMVKGRRWKVSLDEWLGHEQVRSVGAAEDVARQMVDAMKAGTFSPLGPAGSLAARAPRPTTSAGHTFASVAATYRAIVEEDPERKKGYKANLRYMVALVTGWPVPDRTETLGELPIASIDSALIARFYKAQVARGMSASYRNKMVQFVRHFSRWAVREGYRPTEWIAPDDASHTIKRRKAATRTRRLSLPVLDARGRALVAGEYERLLAVADPRLRDLCIASFESGARLAELTTLQWRAVDLPRNQVTFHDSKDPDGVETRTLPLLAPFRAVLEARQVGPDGKRHAPDAFVFGNDVGEQVRSIATAWRKAVLRSHGHEVARDPTTHGLTPAARAAYRAIDLVFHDIRHEAASQWYESGRFSLVEIQFLLGHKSLETTRIYLNVRPEGLAEKMAAYDVARTESTGKSGPQVAHNSRTDQTPVLRMAPRNGRKSRSAKELA